MDSNSDSFFLRRSKNKDDSDSRLTKNSVQVQVNTCPVACSLKHKASSEIKNIVISKKIRPSPSLNKFNVKTNYTLVNNPVFSNCTVTTGDINNRPRSIECSQNNDSYNIVNKGIHKSKVNGIDNINYTQTFNVGPVCTVTSDGDNSSWKTDKLKNIDVIDLSFSDGEQSTLDNINLGLNTKSDENHEHNTVIDCFESKTPTEKPLYFSDLIKIFPNDNEGILLKLCANRDINSAVENILIYHEKNKNHLSKAPTEHLRQHTINKVENDEPKIDDDLYNKQLIMLKEILVHADPIYLENEFKNNLQGDQNKIDAFVTCALEKKNIPTVEMTREKLKSVKQWAAYSTDFTVETFLKEIPEPLTYFTQVNDGSSYKNISLEYLKQRYCRVSVQLIKEIMAKHNNNLTTTYLNLAKLSEEKLLLRKRTTANKVIEHTLASLKEVCFIEHKEEIMSYLKSKRDEKQDAFIKAKEHGELCECNCCFNDEVLIEEVATCPEGHIFCKDCIRKGVETKIGEGITKFSCLTECDSEFNLHTLKSVLNTQLFTKITLQKQSEEIKAANIPDIEDCPFCEYLGIPVPESTVFTCLNPECGKESCRKCHEENHIPLRCEEVEQKEEIKLRIYIEDKMTEALIRKCYKCQKEFIKESGCNKIVCSCSALQCYICRQRVKDYSHFYERGRIEPNKCPLYSTDEELHVDAVKAAATAAMRQTLTKDIKLKHDPTKILPVLKK